MEANKLSAEVTIDTKPAQAALGKLNKSVEGSAAVLGKLKPSAAQGGAALSSLSRIAQDAPFGFIAIQNNVTEAVASFGYLKTATGSTSAALSALGSSLIGPGGILLAFSAITSTVTFLIQKYGSMGAAMEALLNDTAALNEGQKEFNKEQEDSRKAVEGQVVSLEQLVKIASGDIGSKKDQIEALKQLNQQIPDYIGFLTEANIKTAAGAAIIREYTRSLIDAAEAELLAKRAGELRISIGKRDKTLAKDARTELEKTNRTMQAAAAGTQGLAGVNVVAGAALANFTQKAILGTDAVKGLLSEYKELADIQSRLDTLSLSKLKIDAKDPKAGKQLKESIQRFLIEAEFELPLNKITLPKSATDAIEVPVLIVPQIQLDDFEIAKQAIEGFADQLSQEAKTADVDLSGVLTKPVEKELDHIKGILDGFKAQGLEADSFIVAEEVAKAQARLAAIEAAFVKLQTNLRAIIATFTVEAFAGIGEVIGAGIAQGAEGIEKAAAAIGGMIGNLFVNLGKEMIAASSIMIALKAALKSLSGPQSLAAGIALVALGSALKSKLSNIGATAFANGGIVTGPTLGMVGEAGQPEVILPLSKLNTLFDGGGGGGGKLEVAVSGDQLLFILNRANRRANRLF